MKHPLIYFLLIASLITVSCNKAKSRTDVVGYNFGCLDLECSQPEEEAIIDSIYITNFRTIPEATVTEDYVYLYGQYELMDKYIRDACAIAEKELASYQFKGGYDFVIHAVYITDVEAFFYQKVYGTIPE